MEEYSGRRAASGFAISRKGPNLGLRDSVENNKERNAQVCSRVGCSSRLNSVKAAQIGSPSKTKTSKTPFCSSGHGKEIIGSSSRAPMAVNNVRRSLSDAKKKFPSCVESGSETSFLQELEEISPSIPTSGKADMRVHSETDDHEWAEVSSAATTSSSSGPANRYMKRNTQRFGSLHRDTTTVSSSFAKQGYQGARNGASTSRYSLRSLRCNSISDVVSSGSSSSAESSFGRRRDIGRKRMGEPENSLAERGKKINGSMWDGRKNDSSNHGISISDSSRNRNVSPGDNEASSQRTRRSRWRTRVSNLENRNRLPIVESPLVMTSSPQRDISPFAIPSRSENQFPIQNPLNRASPFSRPLSIIDHTRPTRLVGPFDVGITRSLMNQDALRLYNLDGIAEMLLALERIEQVEEPTYEQLLVLEMNLFLGGLALHDQHRDMRLDVDNMSYEELLALEERMGSVSAAVPEEALAKCLKRSIFQGTTDCSEDKDDVKCSICQEEYADGHEVGTLGCDHRYHVECINQWLRLKNWCPICKISVAPSPSTPLP